MKILIASSIDTKAIQQLRQRHEVFCAFNADETTLKEHIRDCDILIFRSGVQITAEVMAAAPDLRLLVRAGSGLDNLDVDYARSRNLQLIRIPQPGALAVAEMTFGLILGLSRRILQAHQLLSQGKWAKREMQGHLISQKTLGVVGLGNIGTKVAKLGAAWNMHPIGCVEHHTPEREREFAKQGIELVRFDEVLERADIVTLHVPRKADTLHMMDAEAFAKIRRGSFLVNIARGGIVDELALKEALEPDGHIRGAALDVHEQEGDGKVSPLAGLPNVILTPHIGAMALEAQQEIGRRVIRAVEEFAAASENVDAVVEV